jgi:tetratricopeptide (TPR) repeat protein
MHTFVSMVQVEVRDLEEVSDVLEFNLHEMEYAYFDDRLAEAVEYADRALTIQPHSVLGLLTRAHALAKLGRCQEARANLVGAARAIESHLDVNDRSDRDGPERRRGRAREISTLDLPCR